MLYVFQVETGGMMTFDMNLALDSVSNLKEAIWNTLRIPTDRQVLLVSGGECLDPGRRVCNYTAGTDTNPIFLFNKSNIETSPCNSEGNQSPSSSDTLIDSESVKEQVEGCLAMPPTYMTVVSRAQLAQQLWEMAKDVTRRCEHLIHDQHLQHQGWAAAVANLDDIISAFRHKSESFSTAFSSFLAEESPRTELLKSFPDALKELKRVPLVTCLLGEKEEEEGVLGEVTLLDWIISQDSPNKIERLTDSCYRGMEKLDGHVIEGLQKEANSVIEKAGQNSMREIKGLEQRLYGLDQLLNETKNLVQEQYDLAQAFQQNQNRASDLKDSSILPDLCNSHQHQLLVMSKNHQQLEDIRRRCQKAKEELCVNLFSRLKWVILIQRSLSECSCKLSVYMENLRRVDLNFKIVKQIVQAKDIYFLAVTEVLRRKEFSQCYLQTSNETFESLEKIHFSESEARDAFTCRFEGHFLSALFQGLENEPIPFFASKPFQFDVQLPNIDTADILKLQQVFPSLTQPKLFEMSSAVETIKAELKTKTEELLKCKANFEKVESEWKLEMSSLKSQLREQVDIKNKAQELATSMKAEIQELRKVNEKLENEIRTTRQKSQQELESLKANLESKIEELSEECKKEKEAEVKELKEKHRAEVEGLRSRYRLINSVENRSPMEEKEDYRKKINSEESEDESNVKSLYGLDTSAIDATAMEDFRDVYEMLIAPTRVIIASSKLTGKVTLTSCKVNDFSLIYWNDKFEAYLVYLTNKNVHFLHTDCVKALKVMSDVPVEGFIAQVADKEFCVAKRSNNRYKVPSGFHFYRIRVKGIELLDFDQL